MVPRYVGASSSEGSELACCEAKLEPMTSELVRPSEERTSRRCGGEGDILASGDDSSKTGTEVVVEATQIDVQDEVEVNEESNESEKPNMVRSPATPSRQEVLEHNITHCPFRDWCADCVSGKCKASPHLVASREAVESEVPVVAFDYAFMSQSDTVEDTEDVKTDEVTVGDDGPRGDAVKILVGRDRRSRVYNVVPVPQKGDGENEYATRRVLRFLEFLGYEKVVIKSDQEVALGKVLRNAKTHRGEHTQTMLEQSPVADSRSNGFIERAIQTVEGQIRTMKCALDRRLGVKVPSDWCVIPWLAEHAGNLLTMFEVGQDGKTPFQRLRGRKLRA